jgi:hypothetical protein
MGTSMAPEKMTRNGCTQRRMINARRMARGKIGQDMPVMPCEAISQKRL